MKAIYLIAGIVCALGAIHSGYLFLTSQDRGEAAWSIIAVIVAVISFAIARSEK